MNLPKEQNAVQQARQSSRSTDKLLVILEQLAKSRVPMRLQDISDEVGFTQSTVLRYLRTLQNTNYVYQEQDTQRYALTWKLCQLTAGLHSYSSLGNIVDPFLKQLSNEFHVGGCLAIPNGHNLIYLRYIEHPYAKSPQYIGRNVPLHAGSSGKLLMSHYSEDQIDEYISNRGLIGLTPSTITDRDSLIKELDKIRTQGFSVDNEECEAGFECISYPLYNYMNELCATITLFGTTAEFSNAAFIHKLHKELSIASQKISQFLGWEPNHESEAPDSQA